jgi:nucleotide-binding universal stress UspA family protein
MFAREQGERLDVETSGIVVFSNDVAVELDEKLLETADRIGADLIVMASHIPGVADHLHLIGSNAAYIVRHAKTSVFVVR